MISVNKICKSYKKKQVLSDVSFEISDNEILGLIGPNGAGKSTMMRIISEVNYPTSGTVYKDENVTISVIFDYNALYSQMTAFENLLFYFGLHKKPGKDDEKMICDVLEQFNLLDEKDNKVKTFSKGMLRKLAVARAIIMNPDVLVLDEPFDGLDVESHAYIFNFLKEWIKAEHHAIIISSHNMLEIENICTNIVILDEGKVKLNCPIEDLRRNERKKIILTEHCQESIIKKAMHNIGISSYEYSEKSITFAANDLDINKILLEFTKYQIEIRELLSVYDTLEDIYMMEVKK